MQWVCLMLAVITAGTWARLIAQSETGEAIEIHVDEREASNTCTNGYEKVTKSTLCAKDSGYYVAGSAGVSEADKQKIIDRHNHYRRNVNPTATNMMKVYWDEEAAKGAEKWARQCVVGHDSSRQMSRYIPSYGVKPGQNGAFGYSSWEAAIDGWHNEVSRFTFGRGGTKVGHYTQVVTATVTKVGCGYALCTNSYKEFYFCNYITGQKSRKIPYKKGATCADCRSRCNNNLCDCGHRLCYNGGTMDINKCLCWCPFPYTGPQCQKKDCKNKPDASHCGTQWTKSYCTLYTNVPASCPVMCGLCPAPCNGKKCSNGGSLQSDCSCKCSVGWSGPTCETKSCPPKKDPSYCNTQWPPSYCKKYSNVPAKCPRMCAGCPAL